MRHLFCSVPYIYTLEITADCNANCKGCGNAFDHDAAVHIELEACAHLLARVADYAEMFRITGGEPTTSPVFAELLSQVDDLGKPIVVFTNGLWDDPEGVIAALQRCRHLDGILVSLHGHCPDAYRAFTQGDHFPDVLDNIRRATRAGITVNTNTILTRANIDHMPEVVERATKAGARVVAFSRYYGEPIAGLTDLRPDHYRYAVEQVARFREQGKLVKFNNNIPLCLGGQLTQACPAGDTHCTISPTCDVRLCNHDDTIVGNLLETSIEALWRSPVVQQWRAQVADACGQCAAFELCRGGCRANAKLNHRATDPLMTRPYTTSPSLPSAVRHTLYDGALPVVNFAIHPESFGYVLINRSQIVKVSAEAKPLLDLLRGGDAPLAEVKEGFGQEALDFIGLLYDRRMLELR